MGSGATLEGKVILVTGAAGGIGGAVVAAAHAAGAFVALADLAEDAGREAALSLGERAAFHSLDVADEAAWRTALAAVLARWGRLDGLVNNAGVIFRGPLLQARVEEMTTAFRVNQLGVFLGMKQAAPAMAAGGGGSIVNLSSTAGLVGRPGTIAYSASKWAVRGMTKVAAAELAPLGIRVNSVHPGVIDTVMTSGYTPEGRRTQEAAIPLGRFGVVEEVAGLVLQLLGDASRYSTGSEFVVDGGLTAV